ncbi:MAG: IPExxxVDY family protein [Flavobacterium sp.]|nr:IPExxxVDY family protein [Pedobacter sp.]
MNRTTLKYELDLNFVLLAITAALKDYRICFKINRQLRLNLARINDIELMFNADEKPFYFSRYYCKQNHTETEFNLIANKGSEGFLVPEMKTVDFFILIQNYIDKDELKQIIIGLNGIQDVQVAVEVDPKKLKSKENLIL